MLHQNVFHNSYEHQKPYLSSGQVLHFRGRDQQERVLVQLEGLSPGAQTAFRDIYQSAQDPKGGAAHVVIAMQSAVRFPELYTFVTQNIMMRLYMKVFEKWGQQHQKEKLEERMEDFHTATDAFCRNISLEEAEVFRRSKAGRVDGVETTCGIGYRGEDVMEIFEDPEGKEEREAFKTRVRPSVNTAKERLRYGMPRDVG